LEHNQLCKPINTLDHILQSHFPTVMVPKYEDLSSCEQGKSRLLVARDGLYFDTNLPWGEFTKKLFASPAPFPYGTVSERDTMEISARQVLSLIKKHMLDDIIRSAFNDLEWFGAVAWDGNKLLPVTPDFSASACAVEYSYETLPSDILIVADIHSHGCGRAFFSDRDNRDDESGMKMAFVVGQCCEANSATVLWRYCINRFMFEGGKEIL